MQEMHETQVQSLGWEDPLQEETASHSSILARRIPGTEKPGGLPSTGLRRAGHNWAAERTQCFTKIEKEKKAFNNLFSPKNYERGGGGMRKCLISV